MSQLFSSFFKAVALKPLDSLILVLFLIAIGGLIRMHLKTQIDDNWDQFKLEHHFTVSRW